MDSSLDDYIRCQKPRQLRNERMDYTCTTLSNFSSDDESDEEISEARSFKCQGVIEKVQQNPRKNLFGNTDMPIRKNEIPKNVEINNNVSPPSFNTTASSTNCKDLRLKLNSQKGGNRVQKPRRNVVAPVNAVKVWDDLKSVSSSTQQNNMNSNETFSPTTQGMKEFVEKTATETLIGLLKPFMNNPTAGSVQAANPQIMPQRTVPMSTMQRYQPVPVNDFIHNQQLMPLRAQNYFMTDQMNQGVNGSQQLVLQPIHNMGQQQQMLPIYNSSGQITGYRLQPANVSNIIFQ